MKNYVEKTNATLEYLMVELSTPRDLLLQKVFILYYFFRKVRKMSRIKFFPFSLLLFISLLCTVQAEGGIEEIYLTLDYPSLFNQKKTISKYKDKPITKESIKELEKDLLDDFKKQKKEALKLELLKPAIDIGIIFVALGCLPSFFEVGNLGESYGKMMGFHLASSRVQHFAQVCWRIYYNPSADPLNQYEEQYVKRKRNFPHTLQKIIEDKFSTARHSIVSLQDTKNFCRFALKLPTKSTLVSLENIEAIGEKLNYYEPPIYPHIIDSIMTHASNFTHSSVSGGCKSVLYFQGPPGLGKTYAAELIAKNLKLPFLKILLTQNGAEVFGNQKSPGSILEAIGQKGSKRNGILFFDEADRVLNDEKCSILPQMLTFLEKNTHEFFFPYLEAKLDISHYFIILAGNTHLKEDAFNSRFTTVCFKNINKDYKKKVAWDNLLPSLLNCNNSELRLEKKVFTEDEINLLVDQDKESGFRDLEKELETLVNKKRLMNQAK